MKSYKLHQSKLSNTKTLAFNFKRSLIAGILMMIVFFLSLTGTQKIQAQTYGLPLFTEDFGTVPTGQDANTYRGEITGRGTIGSAYWFWPYTCTGTGWMSQSTPTTEYYSGVLPLPIPISGVTDWSFVQVTVNSGIPYNGTYLNDPSFLWCLNGTIWTGPNPGSCAGISVRWYNIDGTWELGRWQRNWYKTSVACSAWHNGMDDGGYALSANPDYVHGYDHAWLSGPDHTPGDVNGMMLVVNAAWVKGQFYKRAIPGLCYGSQFEFKAFYANILSSKATCSPGIPINIRFEVWDKDPGDDESNSSVVVGGTAANGAKLIAYNNTGDIPGGTSSTTLTWHENSIIFTVPQDQNNVVVVLRNNGVGGCGNDLAIDDITFSPYIPFTIAYNAITTNYCSTGEITLHGTVSGIVPLGYLFQWQVADNGSTNWTNIGSSISDPASVDLVLNISEIGNKIYRVVSGASALNFNNSNCSVASSNFNGNSVVIPTGSITATPDVCGTALHAPVNATFTVNYQGNVFPWTYYYKINGGAEQSQTVSGGNTSTQTINIKDNTTVTLVKISTDGCDVLFNTDNSDKLITYSTGVPPAPVQIIGPDPDCSGSEADFSVPEVPDATSYTWTVSGDWQIISGQGTRFVHFKIGTTPISVTIISSNACGTNSFTSDPFQTTNLPPVAPADITTLNGICFPDISTPGSTDILFEASEVSGAQNYEWSWDSPVVYNDGSQQSGTGQYLRKIILSVPNSITSFKVRVKTQNGCGESDIKEVTFAPNRPPAAIAGSDRAICLNANTILGAASVAGSTYSWTSAPAGFSSAIANPSVIPFVTSTYTVVETITATGCTNAHSVLITVNPLPVAPTSITVDRDNFCPNDAGEITLTATGGSGSTMNWFANSCGGTSIGIGTSLTIASPTVTTTYYANWTNVCGTSTCATHVVTVTDNQKPTITAPAAVSVNSDAGKCTASGVVLGTPVTADNCSVASITNNATEPFALGNTSVTWTVTDGSGNTQTATQLVTVTDTEKPTITAPAAVSVSSDAGKCTASGIALGSPVTADNCSVASVTNNAAEPFALGNTTVTWTVTDASGNTQTATQVVTVTDNQKPSITAPGAVSVSSDAGKCTATGVVLGTPVTGDNCSVALVTNNAVEPFALGSTTVTWTVTYASGNTQTATQIVTVTDNQKPSITAPGAVSVSSDAGKCTATGVVFGTSVTADNCSVASVTNNAAEPFALGNTTVTWTVTDASGNSQTATQIVTVTDNQKPSITAPEAVSVSSDQGKCTATGVVLGTPITGDNCSVASVTNNAAEPFAIGNTTVTWTVTDGSGNTQTATQTVTVTDNQKPTITAPAAVTVSSDASKCTATGVVLGTPVTADNCSVSSVTNNAVEPFALGNTMVTWTVTGGSGNTQTATQTVTVTDNQKPTITAPSAVSVSLDAGKCTASGVTLGTPVTADNCSVATVTNNATQPFALGNTTVTWTVTDASGNTQTATQLVTVTDNQKPTITAPSAVTVSSDADKYTANGVVLGTPVTADNCSVASVTNNATEPFAIGNTTVTWTVTDASGNTQTTTQVVTVTDNQKPTITTPGAVTVSSDEGKCTATGVVLGTPVTADNCSVASVTNNATEPFAIGNTTVTWIVIDVSGNTQTAMQIVTVTDNQKPSITVPSAVIVSSDEGKCTATGVVLGTPVTGDNCSVASVTNNATEPFAIGNTTITWTVTDASGNTQTAAQIVTVTDNQKPTITTPAVVSVSADAGKTTATGVVLGTPVTSDNCMVASLVNDAVESFASGSTTVTWTVTDASGNTETATQIITVTDNEKPAFTRCLSGSNQSANTDAGTTTYVNKGDNWNPVATDNDMVISLVYNLSGVTTGSGTSLNDVTFNMGVTTVTWLATDKTGNVSTCIFNVTVVDNENPVFIKCMVGQDIILKSAVGISTRMIIGNDMNATTIDNDRIVSLTYTLTGATTGTGTSLNNLMLNAGETTITWTAADNAGNTTTCQFKVTVLDSSLPPTAVDDQFTVKAGTELSGDVRLNDYDITEPIEMLKVKLSDPAKFGKLSLNENGTFTYIPDPEFVGIDHFTYEICKTSNASLCSQAKVTINVVTNTDCKFFVPNGFSPDGDGINDFFKIKCISNYPNALLRIFTRSGIRVYEQKHYGNIDFWGNETDAWWDGRTSNGWNVGGNKLASGTYIFILELIEGNKDKVLTGSVFLSK